jgi:hypothetical protein
VGPKVYYHIQKARQLTSTPKNLVQNLVSFVFKLNLFLYYNWYIPGLESREYDRRDTSRWPRGTLYPQKLALTSPKSGGRSVGIVRSRTQTTEFFMILLFNTLFWI